MKRNILNKIAGIVVFLLLIIPDFTLGQKILNQIEINPFVRIDRYPQFSYVFRGRPSTDYVKIKGTSYGLNLAYKIPFSKTIIVKPGIGFYRYSFNNIEKENTIFGKSNVRNINFQSSFDILLYTDKYWYNTISANIGIEKVFNLKKSLQIATAINFNNYYTFSQYYHLSYNPEGNKDYSINQKRYFGFSTNFSLCILKQIGKVNIGPSIILPVFDLWKKDDTFPGEANSETRNKWFNGVGLGLSLNYSLANKMPR